MTNPLPQGWKEDRIDNLSYKILSGGTPNRSISSYYGGNIPWVKTGEVQDCVIYDTEEKITEEGLKNSSAKVFPKGTLLVALYGATAAKLAILAIDAATNQACCGIQVDESKILMKYIYYYLLDQRSNLLALTSGAGQQNLNVGKIKNYYISYPTDKDEQDYIVKTLDAVAEMIKLRKETIQLTKDLIPAIFHEMFGDPNIENKNYVPFNQFFVVVNNEKKEIKSEDYRTKADGLLPVVDQGQKEIVAYTEQLDKKISAYNNPIILFGDHTREVKFIDFDFVVGADGTQLMRTVDGVEPLFAFWQLKMKHIESRGYSRHFKYVKAMQFLKPDIVKQEEFADKVEQINMYIAAQQEELEQFETLFQSLLQEAFTGVLTWNYPRKECHDKKDK
ncbi:MAG: restriction endonuclease subunit S [Acetobacter sp.]|nr:restriction endonuclease subunit S [Acetobacter sp.]